MRPIEKQSEQMSKNNRRDWLKLAGLGITGMSIGQLNSFANVTPISTTLQPNRNNATILLRSNENPYGPSPKARIAMSEHINDSNRYGRSVRSNLISAIAEENEVSKEQILLEAGSTKILDLLLQFSATKKGNFVLAKNTYNYWTSPSNELGIQRIEVPLKNDKKHDLKALLNAIETDTRMMYICNPDNPTGTIIERDELKLFINEATKKTMVVVDEAYIEYSNQKSVSNLTIENKNLIVVRTFSKMYGLAGARVGYAIANKSSVDKLRKLQSWSNGSVSVISAAGALASLRDMTFRKKVYLENEKVKKYTIEEFERIGISCIQSHSNFIYFSLANYKKDFFKQLEENNILGTRVYEEDGKWSRITIGTIEEMKKVVASLK